LSSGGGKRFGWKEMGKGKGKGKGPASPMRVWVAPAWGGKGMGSSLSALRVGIANDEEYYDDEDEEEEEVLSGRHQQKSFSN